MTPAGEKNETASRDTQSMAASGMVPEAIPEQTRIPWRVAVSVSWGSLKRRFGRSLVTMLGVILAIAFLTYMLVTHNINNALVMANVDRLNTLLQKAGVDILRGGGPDRRMILLISLALFTCLVGIVNSMLMSVTERIKEIGTMKCLGALDSFILKTYFIESSLQGVLGTLLGMLLGALVGMLASLRYFGTFVFQYFPLEAVGVSLAISLAVGALISVVAAIAPARWAATKQPVDAMRVEE